MTERDLRFRFSAGASREGQLAVMGAVVDAYVTRVDVPCSVARVAEALVDVVRRKGCWPSEMRVAAPATDVADVRIELDVPMSLTTQHLTGGRPSSLVQVQRLTSRWGLTPGDSRTVVWAEIPVESRPVGRRDRRPLANAAKPPRARPDRKVTSEHDLGMHRRHQ